MPIVQSNKAKLPDGPIGEIPDFPAFIDFHQLKPEVYLNLANQYEPYSDFNYLSIYCWSSPGESQVSKLNKNIVLRLPDYFDGEYIYCFLGKFKAAQTTHELFSYLKSQKQAQQLELIPEIVVPLLDSDSGIAIEEDIDNHDYILSAKLNSNPVGKQFASKRRFINSFVRNNNFRTVELNLSDKKIRNEILNIVKKWKKFNTEGSVNAKREIEAVEQVLHLQEYILDKVKIYCIGVYIDEKLEAFCVSEILNDDYAVLHFIKANLNIKHLHEFTLTETLRLIYQNFGVDKVNYEQDLGINGLRNSKKNQKPVAYLKKYRLSLK
jgi:hypothetical protein